MTAVVLISHIIGTILPDDVKYYCYTACSRIFQGSDVIFENILQIK